MKTCMRNIFVVAALISSCLALADSGLRKDVPITVTVASSVQEQMSKLSPADRKRFEEAVKVGNKFIPHHFDGSAYNVHEEDEILESWLKDIRPLVAGDDMDWSTETAGGNYQESVKILGSINEEQESGYLLVCPQIELSGIDVSNDYIDLKYRAKVIGMLVQLSLYPYDIRKSELGAFHEVALKIDKINKVKYVVSQDDILARVPSVTLSGLEWVMKHPENRTASTYDGLGAGSLSSINALNAKDKRLTKKIHDTEMMRCSDATSNQL